LYSLLIIIFLQVSGKIHLGIYELKILKNIIVNQLMMKYSFLSFSLLMAQNLIVYVWNYYYTSNRTYHN